MEDGSGFANKLRWYFLNTYVQYYFVGEAFTIKEARCSTIKMDAAQSSCGLPSMHFKSEIERVFWFTFVHDVLIHDLQNGLGVLLTEAHR